MIKHNIIWSESEDEEKCLRLDYFCSYTLTQCIVSTVKNCIPQKYRSYNFILI